MTTMSNNGNGAQGGNGHTVIYSPGKIAEMLDVKASFVNREIREGHLKGFKVGKSWRVTHEALEEYFTNRTESGNGKRKVSHKTKDKIRFHANVRRMGELPGAVEKIAQEILRIKDELPEKESYEKLAIIIKMKKYIDAKAEREAKLATKEQRLDELVDNAYPGMRDLLDMNADELEAHFLREENGQPAEMAANAD